MAKFIPILAKNYNPSSIDSGIFAMYIEAPHCVPLICTSEVGVYGNCEVNGKKVGSGKCAKLDVCPLPILFVPIGEEAREFGKTYNVKLYGYKNKKGKKFTSLSFKVKTAVKGVDDGMHFNNEQNAKDVSDEGITLLKNDGTLPLEVGTKVRLLGDYKDFRITAIGAGFINPRWNYDIEEAIDRNGKLFESDDADIAIYFISRGSGENKDNRPIVGNYYLTDEEKNGLKNAAADYKKVILVLNVAYPVEMKFISGLDISAIIWTGLPGQRGSESLVDILTGDVNPSGRLADTWSYDYYDNPSSHNFINLDAKSPYYAGGGIKRGCTIYYEERQFVGYRYFDTYDFSAAYLFGSGLSYTDFAVKGGVKFNGNVLSVNVTVKNKGNRPGKNSVLIYVELPDGRLKSPKKVFCGFEKTDIIEVGGSSNLTVEIPAKDFACFDDEASSFVLQKGEYTVFIGGSVTEAQRVGSFTVVGDEIIEKSLSVCKPLEEVGSINECGEVKEKSGITSAFEAIKVKAEYEKKDYAPLKKYKGKTITLQNVKNDETKLSDFVSQFSLKTLASFSVLNGTCFAYNKSGAAGKVFGSKKYGIPKFYMSDGNCGVNLHKKTIGFPTSNVLACTFNKNLAYKVGASLSDESKENDISINLGPAGNLHRNILCGRHPEYFSEDPILAGTLMAYQAKGLEENGTVATYKHFLANGIEFERKSAHSCIDERTVRELYLRVFDKAFSLYKPQCVMTSYNPVNGIYPCENSVLLNDLLRDKWGFNGFVMTDWGSYDTCDEIKAINAGCDMVTPGDKKKHFRHIYRAAKKGEITLGTLQNNVKNIIKVLVKCLPE